MAGDSTWQVTLRSSKMGSDEELFTRLSFKSVSQ